MRFRGAAVALVSAAVVVSALTAVSPASAVTPRNLALPTVSSPVPQSELCRRPLTRLEVYRSSSRFDLPSELTLLGETRPIDLTTLQIKDSPFPDPSRAQWYRSLLWLAIAAVDASENGRLDEAESLAVPMIKAATDLPDPGSATPEQLAQTWLQGWNFSTAFRRTEALLCLSAYTGVERVRPLLEMHVQALLDPNRYLGPPDRPVQNQGMIANLVLVDAAVALGRPEYAQIALARLRNDYSQVFSNLGWSYENSTHYHTVNILGWREVQTLMLERGMTADAAALSAELDKATDAAAQIISPTGRPVLFGNTRPTDPSVAPAVNLTRPLTFVDQDGGLAIGRWSWTDPKTTFWTAMNSARTKYGHAHRDATSMTWQTEGIPILTEVGQPDYELANPLTDWARGGSGQNRALPPTESSDESKTAKLRVRRDGALDTVLMESTSSGTLIRRQALIDEGRNVFEVNDSAESQLTQHWHLSPEWKLSSNSGSQARLAGPNGRVLRVSTAEGTITSLSGSLSPLAGFVTTGFEAVAPAVELQIAGGNSLSTVFSLERAAASPPLPKPDFELVAGNRRIDVVAAPEGNAAERRKKPQGSGSVKGYRVQTWDAVSGWNTVVADTGSIGKVIRLRRLTNGQVYRVRVAPLTGTAMGSYVDLGQTVPRTLPQRPELPVVERAGNRKATISWSPPTDDGGLRVKSYQVTIGGDTRIVKRPRITLTVGKGTARRPADLPVGRRKVTVAAVNALGDGVPLRVSVTVNRRGAVPTQ